MSTLINKLYDKPISHTNPIILLQQGLPQGKHFHFSNELSSFLIKLTLNELWAAGNLGTFESKQPSVQTIISKIKTCIRHRILVAHHISHGPDFSKSWAHRNVLSSYKNNTLTIHFEAFIISPVPVLLNWCTAQRFLISLIFSQFFILPCAGSPSLVHCTAAHMSIIFSTRKELGARKVLCSISRNRIFVFL